MSVVHPGVMVPLTPLHYPVAYAVHKSRRSLSMPGLIVGSFVPDIEVPLLLMFDNGLPDHWILHSLIGALTLGLIISLALTRFVYPPMVGTLFGMERTKLNAACKTSKILVVSCLTGLLGHLLLDLPMHPYNPLFWPWVDPTTIPGALVLLFAEGGDLHGGFIAANQLVTLVMLALLLAIAIKERHGLRNGLLLGQSGS